MRNKRVEKLVKLALLCAMSLVLMYVVRFPLIPTLPFLEYDMADVPILIGAFMFGPLEGLLLTAVVSLLQALTVSAGSGWGRLHYAFLFNWCVRNNRGHNIPPPPQYTRRNRGSAHRLRNHDSRNGAAELFPHAYIRKRAEHDLCRRAGLYMERNVELCGV